MFERVGRWWIAVAAAAVVASSLGVATSWSYVKTLWRGVGESVRDATPISFDLKRLNGMIAELVPEIRRNQQAVAQLEVETEYLEREIAQMRSRQQEALAEMKKLRDALGEKKSEYRFASRTYSRQQVEDDLQRRLDRYEENQAQLDAKQQLLAERKRTLEAAKAKVSEYRRQYEQLAAKAESLQAELKLVEAAQAAGRLEFDKSKLGEAKQLAEEVEKRIRTLQRMVDTDRQLDDHIPVRADDRPATERFDELFGPKGEASTRTPSKT